MRSKAPLALMEQAIMLLVFALAAALCLRAFVWADTRSEDNAGRDRALLQAQSAAETLKSTRGDLNAAAGMLGGSVEGGVWTVRYDEEWNETEGEAEYVLRAAPEDSGSDLLGLAAVEVYRDEVCLARLDAAWQEVSAHG